MLLSPLFSSFRLVHVLYAHVSEAMQHQVRASRSTEAAHCSAVTSAVPIQRMHHCTLYEPHTTAATESHERQCESFAGEHLQSLSPIFLILTMAAKGPQLAAVLSWKLVVQGYRVFPPCI